MNNELLTNEPTISTADIETAVIDVMDTIASTGETVGYEDADLDPVDVSGRVLSAIKRIQETR